MTTPQRRVIAGIRNLNSLSEKSLTFFFRITMIRTVRREARIMKERTKKENPTATQEKPVAQPTETDERATYKEALKAEISDVNGKLPVDVETGIRVTKFTIEDNDAVYYYMCDESIVKMQAIEQSQSKMRKGTEGSLRTTSDPETAHLLHMLNRAGMGLIFRYQGTQSGKAVDVRYSPEDVRQIRPE